MLSGLQGATGALLMRVCDVRRINASKSTDHESELLTLVVPEPFTMNRSTSLVVPDADQWAKFSNGLAKIDAKASGWFKKSNPSFIKYNGMLLDARQTVVQGQRDHFLRDMDKLCAELTEQFPREVKVHAVKEQLTAIKAAMGDSDSVKLRALCLNKASIETTAFDNDLKKFVSILDVTYTVLAFSSIGSATKGWTDASVQHLKDMAADSEIGAIESYLKLSTKIQMHVFDKVFSPSAHSVH